MFALYSATLLNLLIVLTVLVASEGFSKCKIMLSSKTFYFLFNLDAFYFFF